MPVIVKDEGKKFHLAPAGMVQAVCFDFWDLGLQNTPIKGGKNKIVHKGMVAWELNEPIVSDDDFNGKRYRIYKKYTLSLNEKSNLSKDLTSWRGKPFTDLERKGGFDVESIVGANCFLNIVHVESDGKTYANISAVNPLPKNMPLILPENARSIPEWIVDIQAKSEGIPSEVAANTEEHIPF